MASLDFRAPDGVEVGVAIGDGGAGKTRAVKRRLVKELRARPGNHIALVTASTNLAATNYERGMSTHLAFESAWQTPHSNIIHKKQQRQ